MASNTVLVITTSTVRPATPDDKPAIAAMVPHFIEETAYKARLSGQTAALDGLIDRFLTQDAGVIFVAERDSAIVGMIAVVVFPNMVSGETTASELIWWVEPVARDTRAGMKLLKAAQAWAREHGAVDFQLVSWQGRLDDFYTRLGFEPMETVYHRRLSEET